MRVGENIDAVIAIDGPQLAASVAREARVAHWIDVAGAHLLPGMKARRHRHVATGDALRCGASRAPVRP